MKLPNNFYKPLAIGAPTPFRELPVRPERVVHFFPPHIEKIRARLGEHTDEILMDLLGLPTHDVGALHDAGIVAGPDH